MFRSNVPMFSYFQADQKQDDDVRFHVCLLEKKMLLPDFMIRERLTAEDPKRRLVIRPFVDYGQCPRGAISYGLSSAGYDLRLGKKFMIFANTSGCLVNPKKFRAENFQIREVEYGETCVIPPNCFALAETVEYVEVPHDILIIVLGKSTYARCGSDVNFTPFEPAWRGKVTVEIANTSPLPLEVYAGEGIAQMLFFQLAAVPERTYDSKPNAKYQDQKGLTVPPPIGE